MMKNEGSMTGIKSTYQNFALLFWNSKIILSQLCHIFGPSEQIFDFITDSENLQPKVLMTVK